MLKFEVSSGPVMSGMKGGVVSWIVSMSTDLNQACSLISLKPLRPSRFSALHKNLKKSQQLLNNSSKSEAEFTLEEDL